ncbi:hypothetical protein [Serratia fonticola]|uniref:Uncharacterized protein n=1 Tax=Serratia fonticola TaxID=47917 RepID=A0AAW3WX06_SERFO|nr:hypothetical protein [Serratia fonticola]MBC3214778.1 hypothetical protein [Serratia fonticola]NYA15829.1 hypothetical protein [Serratia fonticola]NYA35699.1 hypothetical protein [Serratia fonticola]
MNGVAIIKVNDIDVGAMPEEQYQSIVRAVKKGWRNWILFAFSLFRYVFKIANVFLNYFIKTIAVLVVFFLISSALSPENVTAFISSLNIATPADITAVLRDVSYLSLQISVLSFSVKCFFLRDSKFTYVSPFENAINNKIRAVMEVPANGYVTITIENRGEVADVR